MAKVMRRAKRKHPEADLQRTVAAWLGWSLPKNYWWTAFPAGGGGKIRGAILKSMGLKPGVPDILILGGPKPIWLELKSKGGRLSEAQSRAHIDLRLAGCIVRIVRSLDDVAGILVWRK